MPITATNRRYCYMVPSDSHKGRGYEVDLTANNGGGHCPCRDFAFRRQPALDAGAPPLTQATMCRHLRLALWFFLRDLMPAIAKQEYSNPKKYHERH